MADESKESEAAELMAKGHFSSYHLLRARQAMEAGNFKEAAYQASASLSHDPRNADARALRAAAQAKQK